MLGVGIAPPHLTALSMKMAVALYVTGFPPPRKSTSNFHHFLGR
jgi:hypothetical protein